MDKADSTRLEIHFYGEPDRKVVMGLDSSQPRSLELAVRLNLLSSDPSAKRFEEVYTFAWYELFQFWFLGHNPASAGLAGLLVSPVARSLFAEHPVVEPAATLVAYARSLSKDDSAVKHGDLLKDVFFGNLPRLVSYSGKSGDRVLSAMGEPRYSYRKKGFGFWEAVLGAGTRYFACHSVIGLFRFLGMHNLSNDDYVRDLCEVARSCAHLHLQRTQMSLKYLPSIAKMVIEQTALRLAEEKFESELDLVRRRGSAA